MRVSILHKVIGRELARKDNHFMQNIWRKPNHEQKESGEAAILRMALIA